MPDIPFTILFHRTSTKNEKSATVPNLRSLKLETLHTQSIDLNQFKKLFVNLESLETLIIDNYELDTNGKGLRMKRSRKGRRKRQLSSSFNARNPNNITNSKSFFMNKMLRSTMLNNALQNALNNNNHNPISNLNTGQPVPAAFSSNNRFKSTPFNNFVTPNYYAHHQPINNQQHFESNRLINIRAINQNQKPPPFDLLTTISTIDDHTSSMIFRHFDAINPQTTTTNSPLSRYNTIMRITKLPNLSTSTTSISNLNLNNHHFSPSSSASFQPSSFQTTNTPINFNNRFTVVTTPLPPIFITAASTITTTTTMNPRLKNNNNSSSNSNIDNGLLTSDSRLISNHMNAAATAANLMMSNHSSIVTTTTTNKNETATSINNNNNDFIGLENQPNRMIVPVSPPNRTPLLTNMLNKRNNTGRPVIVATASAAVSAAAAENQLGNQNARKLNFNFNSYFPNLKVLKMRSLLTNYDKDNAYFVKEMLTGLSSLEIFEFSKNIIYVLPSLMFATLTKLKYLYLNHNQIQQLERDALVNLKFLEALELENNDLKEINEDTFRLLANLKQIKLKRNKFRELPERLFSRNRNLIDLDLSQNRDLSSLPDHLLRNLNQLHNLSVFDCQLAKISSNPSAFFANAPQLRNIYMRNNRLKYLNMRNLFAFNGELIKLDLAYNDIAYLSSDIFSINSSSLIELNLYANNLIEVPSNLFTNLKNLKILNLGFNNLTEIDVSIFFSLKNLEELDLSKNLLTTINPKKYSLPFGIGASLRTINLAHNKLTSFANEFGAINWSLYLMLAELNLSNNLLSGDLLLPVFYSSSKMKLDLRQNQFTTILIDEIELNEKALLVDMKSTKYSSKEAENESKSKTQVSIYLAHNPINCNCRLYGFVNYTRSVNGKYSNLIEKVSFDTEYLECQQPDKLSRTLIEQLNDADLSKFVIVYFHSFYSF